MRVEGTQEAIISKEDFERVLAANSLPAKETKERKPHKYLPDWYVACGLWMVNEVCDEQAKIKYRIVTSSCTCYSQ